MEVIKNLRGQNNLALQNLKTIQLLEGRRGLVNAFFPLNLFLTKAHPSKKAEATWSKTMEILRLHEGVCVPGTTVRGCVAFTAGSTWEVSWSKSS